MSFERTPYDYEMLRNYNHDSFHAAPWPTPRTHYDQTLQHTWCPTCEYPIPTPPRPPHPSPPHPSPRPHPHIIPGPYGYQPNWNSHSMVENYGNVIQTPHGNVRNPYQSCGNTHSSGPSSTPSTREPVQMPMGANPPNPLFKDMYKCDGPGTGPGPVKDGCPMTPIGNEGCACYELAGGGMLPYPLPCYCYPHAKNEGDCGKVYDWLNKHKTKDVKAVQCFFNGKMQEPH